MLRTANAFALLSTLVAAAPATGAPVELRLVLIDFVSLAPQVREGMWTEARRLLGPRGVSLVARAGDAAEQRDEQELAVVLLSERSRGRSRGGPRLGAVQTAFGVTTIWIDVKAVASVADANRGLHCCNVEMRRLALALGRVLTHELVHFLDPGAPHARGGLMAARVGRTALVDDPAPLRPFGIAKRRLSDSDH